MGHASILLKPDIASLITSFMSYDTPQIGMLAQVSKDLNHAFKAAAEDAGRRVRDDRRFLGLCKFIISDLTQNRNYEQVGEHCSGFTNESLTDYFMTFRHTINDTMLHVTHGYLSRHSVRVEAEAFGMEDDDSGIARSIEIYSPTQWSKIAHFAEQTPAVNEKEISDVDDIVFYVVFK